jgi:thioredoxin 1
MPDSIEATERNWDEILGGREPVLVDFWAPWCGWCRKLAPSFEQLASEFAGRVKFVKVNVDEESHLAARYGVQGLPTLKFFCEGEPVHEVFGYLPESVLRRKIEEVLNADLVCNIT